MAPTKPLTDKEKEKLVLNTHLQELALMILGGLPIKHPIQKAADKSRGLILASLKPAERELYLASRNVMLEFGKQLAGCQSLEMLAKVLQIVQGISQGRVVEYEAVKDQLIDEPLGWQQ